MLTAAPGLLYCGMGVFLNYVSTEAVGTANLRQISLALLFGNTHTKESLRRQAYLESRLANALILSWLTWWCSWRTPPVPTGPPVCGGLDACPTCSKF